jgi:hypothetical protein
MDEEVIEAAKRVAAEEGTSVSAMFSRIVRAMAYRKGGATAIGPRTRSVTGIARTDDIPPDSIAARATGFVSLPEGKTWRDVLTDALLEKYGIKE